MAITDTAIFTDIFLASGLLFPGSNIDIVGIYNSDTFKQVFQNARPVKASVSETSKVMEHPTEKGIIISDHHIINQVAIDLAIIIKSSFYTSVYQEIKKSFINADKLIVQTKASLYPDMIIANMPHEESPDIYDAILIGLQLKQVLYVSSPSTYAPADPVNNNTQKIGLQSGQEPTVPLTDEATRPIEVIFRGGG